MGTVAKHQSPLTTPDTSKWVLFKYHSIECGLAFGAYATLPLEAKD